MDTPFRMFSAAFARRHGAGPVLFRVCHLRLFQRTLVIGHYVPRRIMSVELSRCRGSLSSISAPLIANFELRRHARDDSSMVSLVL